MYKEVNQRQSFPEMEKNILKYWKENNTFKKSIEIREGCEEFNFYDGPPFATGTPHYGHLLAGTLKDVVPRYQTMKGKKVERNFGWDCHGLPIENIVEKKLGISGKHDIEDKIGVYKFNEECRNNVMTYTEEWRRIVEKMGRWVDMDNDYKTMDASFMESVWWVFKSLYDKGYIYESHRVVPYCPRCSTPLSNFEVNQGYEDRQDKSITVKFRVKDTENKYILAWTTTPWTLPANLGLAVGEDVEYAEVLDKDTKETYVLAKDRVSSYYKNEDEYSLLRVYKGACLNGLKYEPLFNDFQLLNEASELPRGQELGENVFSVVLGHHVTTDSGTGVVHIAPAFGEDDNIIGKEQKLGYVAHIGDVGEVEIIAGHEGEYVFDFNESVIKKLKESGEIVNISSINHSYPHCYRCQTPLIYKGISAWYVKVEDHVDKLVKNNEKIKWVPANIKTGRFGKWIEQARDWNISRNRYWGSAIPIWKSEDSESQWCIGSIEELYELNKDFGDIEKKGDKYYYKEEGIEVDIHKHFVDRLKIKHPENGKTLTRIPEVLDCWFESGSMPYAEKHYPFAYIGSPVDKDTGIVEGYKFPAEFIAEGVDQTRGWFYTLLILGTLLFDNTPYLNVIVNGTILAEDGKKMSKSLQNYPDPEELIDSKGSDAIRFYMLSSSVVKAEDFRFSEQGVDETVKKVLLPFWNTYSFFVTYANIDNFKGKDGEIYDLVQDKNFNNLDRWMLSEVNKLSKDIEKGFQDYDMQAVTRPVINFMDNLTNWYIRRSRRRFWKSENDSDKMLAYKTLYQVLVDVSRIIAPIVPFISEEVFRGLTSKESVHLENFPEFRGDIISEKLSEDMDKVQKIVNLGLALRANKKIRVRQPLASITIGEDLSSYYIDILKDELNVKEVKVKSDMGSIAKKICRPFARVLGPRFGGAVQEIIRDAKNGDFTDLGNGEIKVGEHVLEEGEYEIAYEAIEGVKDDIQSGFGFVIAMDTNLSKELLLEGYTRDIIRTIQDARKEAGYNVSDRITLSISGPQSEEILNGFKDILEQETLSSIKDITNPDIEKEVLFEDFKIKASLKK